MPTIYEAVDEILLLIERAVPGEPGVLTRDRNDVALLSAYGRGYRCLRSIRYLAGVGEAGDAAVLTRSLVSTVLRSLYLVQDDDPEERQRRLAQLTRRWRREGAAMLNEMHQLGFRNVTQDEVEAARELSAQHEWAGPLPSDQQLATMLNLAPFYASIYRETSDAAHFGIATLLAGFAQEPTSTSGEGAIVALDMPDANKAAEILLFAALTMGAFLDSCEPVVHHGLTARVGEILTAWDEAEGDGPAEAVAPEDDTCSD